VVLFHVTQVSNVGLSSPSIYVAVRSLAINLQSGMPSMRLRALHALVLSLLLTSSALAETPHLVADLKTKTDSAVPSTPRFFPPALGSAALFTAVASDGSYALWRTDGTSAGTVPLIPINRGYPFLGGNGIAVEGGVGYLSVEEQGGARFWKTDGTPAGTTPLTALVPAQTPPVPLAAIGGKLFFLSNDFRQLAVLDGAAATLLATLSTTSVEWTSIATWRNAFYIGTEAGLWKSDGTAGGTVKVTSVSAFNLEVVHDQLLFAGFTQTTGGELWTTDGTAAGTRMLADLNPGSASTFLINQSDTAALSDRMVFLGSNGELGTSDGTAGGTRILQRGTRLSGLLQMAVWHGAAFFAFDDGTHGAELWQSDGTAASTRMIGDRSSGSVRAFPLVAADSRIYYTRSEAGGDSLYLSDGTEGGTHAVIDRPLAPNLGRGLVTRGDDVFFSNDEGGHGAEPWISDGTAAGTHMIVNLNEEKSGSSQPGSFVAGSDRLYFAATGDEGARSLWSTDGTAAGTKLVLRNDDAAAAATPLAASGNTLFFKQKNTQLWKTAGVPGSETLVKDFNLGHVPPILDALVAGGRLYLRADDGSGFEAWTTDGTPAGTVKLTDLVNDSPASLTTLAGQVYFATAQNGDFYSIGSGPAETRRIAGGFATAVTQSSLIPFKGALYLFTRELGFPEVGAPEDSILWRFSGAAADATQVRRYSGPFTRKPLAAQAGDQLFFTWQDPSHLNQLWKSDGTTAGTVLVKELNVTATASSMTQPVAIGARVVFTVDDGVHGAEPWVSDGTPEGTVLLRDIRAAASSDPSTFVVADGVAYFSADDDEHGRELWQTDGTPAGTLLVADLVPGKEGSSPAELTPFGDALYFSATTAGSGTELWAYPLPNAPALAAGDVRVGEAAGSAGIPVRLTRAATRRVTVRYHTTDGTAAAGRDYTAASGTLTFEPGETQKTMAVAIANDTTAGTTRTFSLRLEDADAAIERTTGTAIIEDDDVAANLALSLDLRSGIPGLVVTNRGPSAASNVRLCSALPPATPPAFTCDEPFELPVGQSTTTFKTPQGSGSMMVHVTGWEPDPDPSNNASTWLFGGDYLSSLYVTPATLRVLEMGTILVARGNNDFQQTTVHLTTSNPGLLIVPTSLTIPEYQKTASTTFLPLTPGVTTLTASFAGTQASVTINVVGINDVPRSSATVSLNIAPAIDFGVSNELSANVYGLTQNGVAPTGSVTFLEDGRGVGQAPLVNGKATLLLYNPTPGSARVYRATYDGDTNFLPAGSLQTPSVLVRKGNASVRALALPGTSSVTIVLTGARAYPPSGTLTVTESGAARPVGGLTPSNDFSSAATASSISHTARTLTITYSGDAKYNAATVTIPIDNPRRHAARH
jgi:ELWxxDGT repeat protein